MDSNGLNGQCIDAILAAQPCDTPAPDDPSHTLYFGLLRELEASRAPYAMGADLMAQLLDELDEARQWYGHYIDCLVELGRLTHTAFPGRMIEDLRADCRHMEELPQMLGLKALFAEETPARCGAAGLPLVAASLCLVWHNVSFGKGIEHQVTRVSSWLGHLRRLPARDSGKTPQ